MANRKNEDGLDEAPDYLRDLKPDPHELDNFGPEDTGPLGGFDADELLREHGHDPETPLHILLSALVAGSQPQLGG